MTIPDHGDTFESAAPLNLLADRGLLASGDLDYRIYGDFHSPGDVDFYKVELSADAEVTIDFDYPNWFHDLASGLGLIIAVNLDAFDDAGNPLHPPIPGLGSSGNRAYSLEAGTYYFRLSSHPHNREVLENPSPGQVFYYRLLLYGNAEYAQFIDHCSSVETSFDDPLLGCQEYLQDINVEDVWATNKGEGVNIAVVDRTMESAHADLRDNVNETLNHDYTEEYQIIDPRNSHGTAVAGVIAARDNDLGVRGVAPGATIYNYNYLENTTTPNLVDAMTRNKSVTAISNNSYGKSSRGSPVHRSLVWNLALETGVSEGFDGKGTFYVFSAGNEHPDGSHVNLREQANFYAQTVVCAVDSEGERVHYSETGYALWICAPLAEVTADNRSRYRYDFGGTSSAAPVVSGVAALVRSANPSLTWRDVKLVLAASARQNDPANAGWEDGALEYGSDAERYSYNPEYGFGVVDAKAAVDLAASWTNLPSMETARVRSGEIELAIPDPSSGAIPTTVSSKLTLGPQVGFTEFVEVYVAFDHPSFRDLEVEILSPNGTVSKLAVPDEGVRDAELRTTFRFGSALHLGEDPSGEWTLKLTDRIAGQEGSIRWWGVKIYGHGEGARTQSATNSPAAGAPGIGGTARVGETLSADVSGVDDWNGISGATFSFQWILNDRTTDTDIPGATEATYTLVAEDEGNAIRVRVTFTDDDGYQETLTSRATAAVAPLGICERTKQVRDAILYMIRGVSHCSEVTIERLNRVRTDLVLTGSGITALRAGDFHDLSSVDGLLLEQNDLSELPGGVFEQSQSLRKLYLNGNDLSELPEGVFEQSQSLRRLYLNDNDLSELPEGVFDQLRSLRRLRLNGNDLSQLPDGIFYGLTNLRQLWLHSNPGAPFALTTDLERRSDTAFIVRVAQGAPFDIEVTLSATGGALSPSSRTVTIIGGGTSSDEITVAPDGDGPVTVSVVSAALQLKPDLTAQGIQVRAGDPLTLTQREGGNTPAVGTPTISGTAQVGETLTADTSGISDDDGLSTTSFSYQWIANDGNADTDIAAATTSTYTLVDTDEGKTIQVRVSFTDDAGNEETLTSAAMDAVVGTVPTEPPAKPSTLTAPEVSHDSVTLRWKDPQDDTITGYIILRRDKDIHQEGTFETVEANTGTADTTYTDTSVYPEKRYVYRIKAINAYDESEMSSWVRAYTPAAPAAGNTPASGEPTISGTVQVGETLTADTSGISDEDGLDNAAFTYQWLAGDVEITGATNATYTLADADEGKAVKVKVSFTDDAGNEETLSSTATAAVTARPNSPATGAPTIGGMVQVGETLTAATSSIADADGLDNASFSHQWLADDEDISGATGSSYTLDDADEGKAIKIRVSFTDDEGNSEELTSTATDPVAAKPNSPATGAPAIGETAQVGETLTADTSEIADEDGLDNATFTYQWLADDADIAGATSSTYTLVDTDEGKAIKVRVSFTDDAGNEETLTSEATAAVAAQNIPATGTPTISGTAQVHETLTADDSSIADTDGMNAATVVYQWMASDGSGKQFLLGYVIEEPNYVVQSLDEGMTIWVETTFEDDAGNSERLRSEETGVVTAAANPTVPEAPEHRRVHPGVAVSPKGSGELEVSWSMPTYPYGDGGSVITGGKVQWKEATGSWDTEADVSESVILGNCTVCQHTIAGLTNGVAYTVRVFATNALGDSPPSDEFTSTPTDGPAFTLSGITRTNYPEDEFDWVAAYTATGSETAIAWSLSGDDSDDFSITTNGSLRFDSQPTYQSPTDADGDNQYQVTVQASDGTQVGTLQVTVVVNSRGLPIIDGSAQVGQTLAADTSGITDVYGLHSPDFTYQWIASDGATNSDISGATASAYTLPDSEKGKAIKVRVSFTDDAGNNEELTSEATVAVAARPNSSPTGAPTISGTAQVGETLTADTSGIADADGLTNASFSYQWLSTRDTEIDGATGSTYTIDAADEGKAVRVRVSFSDDAGNEETLTSEATAAVAPAPSGEEDPQAGADEHVPVWSATMTVEWVFRGYGYARGYHKPGSLSPASFEVDGARYTVTMIETAGWMYIGLDEELPFDFVLELDGAQFASGDASFNSYSYGNIYRWGDTGLSWNDGDTVEVRLLRAVEKGAAVNNPATGAPAIGGTAQVGETLTVDTSGIADEDGLDNATFGYQWLAGDADIPGAKSSSYTLADADEGKAIQVRVTFTDDAGNPETLTSDATEAVVAKPNSPATGAPTISGTVQVGETLTANVSSIADEDGLDNASFGYQWISNDGTTDTDIQDATDSTYALAADDVGKTIKVRVSFTDDRGFEETLTSEATTAVAAESNNPATGEPTINGTVQVGETLTADTSGISDEDGLDNAAFTYQWLADGVEITGASNATYTLADAEGGKAVKVRVSFTDDAGNEETLTSAATDAVAATPASNSPATGAPAISGTAQVGETLTANTSGVVDADGLSNVQYEYQWLADDAEIAGATGSTYTLVAEDEGKAIKVQVSFTDDAGNGETLTSVATDAVSGQRNSDPTGRPTISGTAQVGQKLTVNTSGISDADGLTNVKYGGTWTAGEGYLRVLIAPGKDLSYTVSRRDAGMTLDIGVNFEDDAGKRHFLTSAKTAVVAATSPAAPENFEASSTEPGDLDLSWEAPTWDMSGEISGNPTWGDGGSDITGYVAQWKEESDSWETAADVSEATITGTSHTIEDLTGGTEYTTRVIAVNDVGRGAPSQESTVTVRIASTDATLSALTLSGVNFGTFASGTYSYTATVANGVSQTTVAPTVNHSGASYVIKLGGVTDADGVIDLSVGSNVITIEVTAEDGETTQTYTVTVTRAENTPATGAPTIGGTAQVGKTLTANTSGISDADGLTKVSFSYQWLADDAEVVGATGSTYTLVDADEGKTIKVRVSFTDDAGNGETLTSPATDAVAAAEPLEPPAKPTGLSATASHDQVVLTWDDPGDDSITGYVILRRVRENDVGGEFSVLVPDTGSASTTYTDDTVVAETTYTYRIKAINGAGTSERSRWFHIDIPAAPVPDKPTGLSATATHDSVTLTWDDPGDDSITGYVILRRHRYDDPKGHFDELVADTGTADTTYTDDTVAAGTSYTYRIKAINGAGPGERSRWFHIDTPAAP